MGRNMHYSSEDSEWQSTKFGNMGMILLRYRKSNEEKLKKILTCDKLRCFLNQALKGSLSDDFNEKCNNAHSPLNLSFEVRMMKGFRVPLYPSRVQPSKSKASLG